MANDTLNTSAQPLKAKPMSVARVEIPSNFIANPIIPRDADDSDPRVDIVGPASMLVVWGTQNEPTTRPSTNDVQQIVKPGAPANTVYIYLPPKLKRGRETRRSGDNFPLITLMGPKTFAVEWAMYSSGGTVDQSSPDHTRNAGPVRDVAGAVYMLTNYALLKNNEAQGPSGSMLLWERSHGASGTLYFKDLLSRVWRWYNGSAYVDYNPADLGRPGTAAEGRDPETNALPPADSPDGTSAATVNFASYVWTRGAQSGTDYAILRDGLQLGNLFILGYLVYSNTLYMVTTAGAWYQFIVPNTLQGIAADPRDGSSADHSRGKGPFTDKSGRKFEIKENNVIYVNDVVSSGWGVELLWEKAHGVAGVMYHKGVSNHRYMGFDPANPGVWPDYNPTAFGRTGTAAENRDPQTNALPPADTTGFATTATFGTDRWTLGAVSGSDFIVLRDNVPFPVTSPQVARNFLIQNGILYWVTNAGHWYDFVPSNGFHDYGLVDPRTVVDPSSPDHSRGSGPYTDKQNVVWRVDATSKLLRNNVDTGQLAAYLLWEKTHNNGAGRMYYKLPNTGIFMYQSGPTTWSEFDAQGRDPQTNTLPTTNNPNSNTLLTTANFHNFTWTLGATTTKGKQVIRDGMSLTLNSVVVEAVNFVVLFDILFWVDNTGHWYYLLDGVSIGDAISDPRVVPEVSEGTDVPWIVGPGVGESFVDSQALTWSFGPAGNEGWHVHVNGSWRGGWQATELVYVAPEILAHHVAGPWYRLHVDANGDAQSYDWDVPAPTQGTGVLPDSPDLTYAASMDYDSFHWIRGPATTNGYQLLHGNAPLYFQGHMMELTFYLVMSGLLYWEDNDGDWWVYNKTTNAIGYHGTVDPRDGGPPVDTGVFFDWETSCNISGNTISSVNPTERATVQQGMWLVVLKATNKTLGTGEAVGGSWPSRSVATVANLPNPVNYDWPAAFYVRDSGEVYMIAQGNHYWIRVLDKNWDAGAHTMGRNIPRSYHARVGSISGNGDFQMVDRDGNPLSCTVPMSGATLVINNGPLIQAAIAAAMPGSSQPGLELPNTFLPMAGVCYSERSNFELLGPSKATSGVWSPRGCAPASFQTMPGHPAPHYHSFTMRGNFRGDSDLALDFYEGPSNGLYNTQTGWYNGVNDDYHNNGFMGAAISATQNCHDPIMEDIRFEEYFIPLISSYLSNALYQDCDDILSYPIRDYLGWRIWVTDVNGAMIRRNHLTYTYLASAIEGFKSNDVMIEDNVCQNAVTASNDAYCEIRRHTMTFTAGCCVDDAYQDPGHPGIMITTRIGGGYGYRGGLVENYTCNILGYCRDNAIGVEALQVADVIGNEGSPIVHLDNITVNGPPSKLDPNIAAFDAASQAATQDPGRGFQYWTCGLRAINSHNTDIGNVTVTNGLSRYYLDYPGNAQFAAIYGANGTQLSPGSTQTTDPRFGSAHPGQKDMAVW